MQMTSVPAATALLGVLHPKPVSDDPGPLVDVGWVGNFKAAYYKKVIDLTCACGRCDTITLNSADEHKIMIPNSLGACNHCVKEHAKATTQTKLLLAALNRVRLKINPDQHLKFDVDPVRCTDESVCSRPRRVIYSHFFDAKLKKTEYVLQGCDDPKCLNPYHMYVSSSCAKKVTKQAEKDLVQWFSKGISSEMIRTLLASQWGIELTKRTIQGYRKKWLLSKQTKT